MKKRVGEMAAILLPLLLLTGCGPIGEKQTSISVSYGALAVAALLMLLGYCLIVKKKSTFFLMLFIAIAVVNVGYFTLSLSTTVEEALLANRISYLGSVFLPMSMLLLIMETCAIPYRRYLPVVLGAIGVVMFLITATPGYLDIYYQDAWLEAVNGIMVLHKVYGPWHSVYLYYLVLYYIAIFFVLIQSLVQKRMTSRVHAIAVVGVAVINLGVWLLEQMLHLNFEFLSVSYVISEVSLLAFASMHQELQRQQEHLEQLREEQRDTAAPSPQEQAASVHWDQQVALLTPTERAIYGYYLDNKSTREIMEMLNIKENTLKYHNKNLYSKLGVSSRKELLQIARGEQKGR